MGSPGTRRPHTLHSLAGLLAACLVAGPLLPGATADVPAVEYELLLACPDGAQFCPGLAEDASDAMGAPALAVDPDRPEHMIIASLHGFPDNPGAPSERSRDGQAFTTFTTQNQGRSWVDNPFTPPERLGGGAYGEHPAITIDPYGHVFIGSLYSVPQEAGGFESVIAAQKFRSIGDIDSNQDGEYRVQYLSPVAPNATIEQLWFEYNRITDNMTMVWHETGPQAAPPPPDENGSALPAAVDRLLDSTTQTTQAEEEAEEAPKGAIGVVWTSADVNSSYRQQPPEETIRPCADSTNPVIRDDWLYIGCKAGGGDFRWDPQVAPGDIALFRMHPDGGTPQYLGTAPVAEGAPKIGVRSDGRIALMTSDVTDGRLRLDAVFGQYDPDTGRIAWGDVRHHGSDLPPIGDGTVLLEANIQDMMYREFSGVIQIVLKRFVERPGEDPLTPQTDALEPEIFKSVVAIDETYGVLDRIDLDIGDFGVRTRDPDLMAYSDEAYNDDADDFLELPPGDHRYNDQHLGVGYQREFFAVGSYGIVLFAEVIEKTELRGPAWATPPPPPPPPVPAPAPAGTLALAGAGALSATAIATGASISSKRKQASGAGKKKRY